MTLECGSNEITINTNICSLLLCVQHMYQYTAFQVYTMAVNHLQANFKNLGKCICILYSTKFWILGPFYLCV